MFIVNFYLPIESKAQNNWIVKNLERAHCVISFPSAPVFSNQPFLMWSSKDKDEQVTYLITLVEEPNKKFTIADIEVLLLPYMFSDDLLISKKYLSYKGFEAIDLHYRSNKSPFLYKKSRVIIRGNKIYVLQVLFYYDDLQNFEKFVTSLSFL